MLKANIAVLVSGGGTNLQALLDAERAGKLPHGRIALVVSSSASAYALERARLFGVPAVAVERAALPGRAAYEEEMLRALRAAGAGLLILAGFLPILSAGFVAQYPDRILNVHPSLIPSFCGKGQYGLHVHEAALTSGVKITGATVHIVNHEIDGGRIILQKAVPVKADDTPESLQRRVMEQAEWVLLPRAAELVCREITKREKRA